MTDFVGGLLFSNQSINTFWEIRVAGARNLRLGEGLGGGGLEKEEDAVERTWHT